MPPTTQPTCADAALETFRRDICEGLSRQQKAIPCQYFYDAAGSALFEAITDLDEYYPTRTELAILTACAPAIAALTAPDTALIEYGSGSSTKTEILLSGCPTITHYVPVDVSPTILQTAKTRLAARFPRLTVLPVLGDFATGVALPEAIAGRPKLGFFPGSTIGNFQHEAAVALLARFCTQLGQGGRFILGADLRKSPDILVPAYNDARGVTAAFNRNLLVRINRELGGTFDVAQFTHDATYDVEAGRIDMWLVSTVAQSATVAGSTYHFAAGERIHTEISQKYGIDEMRGLARRAGWRAVDLWTDAERLFSVHAFLAANPS